jgi:ureidoglycolate lyase
MAIEVQTLTADAFAPFGDVIEVSAGAQQFDINYGFTRRYHDLAAVNVNANEGKTGISIFRSSPQPWPINIRLLERHPLSSQAFMPLGPHYYLVVVAPPQPVLDESTIKVFLATPHQGVNYHAGTWHHYSLALNQSGDFLVIDRIGSGPNCDEVLLQYPFNLQIHEVFG